MEDKESNIVNLYNTKSTPTPEKQILEAYMTTLVQYIQKTIPNFTPSQVSQITVTIELKNNYVDFGCMSSDYNTIFNPSKKIRETI